VGVDFGPDTRNLDLALHILEWDSFESNFTKIGIGIGLCKAKNFEIGHSQYAWVSGFTPQKY